MPKQLKVLVLQDEDGHLLLLDISTKARETKVLKGYIQDLIDGGSLDDVGIFDAKLLLEKKNLLRDDEDFSNFSDLHTEYRFDRPHLVKESWPKNFGEIYQNWR